MQIASDGLSFNTATRMTACSELLTSRQRQKLHLLKVWICSRTEDRGLNADYCVRSQTLICISDQMSDTTAPKPAGVNPQTQRRERHRDQTIINKDQKILKQGSKKHK